MRISDQNIHGKHVITADGAVIGTVEAIYFDSHEFQIDSITVKVRKNIAEQLGVSGGMFHKSIVEIPARDVQSVGDTIVLSVPIAGLRAPTSQQKRPAVPQTPEPAHH